MRPLQVLALSGRVDLGVMVMKVYSTGYHFLDIFYTPLLCTRILHSFFLLNLECLSLAYDSSRTIECLAS